MTGYIEDTADKIYTGSCHCGEVAFRATGPMRPIVVCHCTDCLNLAGNSWAATATANTRFLLTKGADTLDWYASSDFAERGFCSHCHAHLFYRRHGADKISISLGALDTLDGLFVSGQIYTKSLPPAYRIAPDAPDLKRY